MVVQFPEDESSEGNFICFKEKKRKLTVWGPQNLWLPIYLIYKPIGHWLTYPGAFMDDLQSERTKISGPALRSSVRVWEEKGAVMEVTGQPGEEPIDRSLWECSWVVSASVNSRTGSLLLGAQVWNGQCDSRKLEREGGAGGGDGRGGCVCGGCSLSTYFWLASKGPWQP